MRLFKDYFYYTKKERLAVFLLCTCISFLLFWKLFHCWLPPLPTASPTHWEEELAAFREHQAAFTPQKSYSKKPAYNYASKSSTYGTAAFNSKPHSSKAILKPFPFDPNTVSATELAAMGLGAPAIKSWVNYRNKGGYFTNKEGVSRIYNLSAKDFQQLKKYIQLPNQKSNKALPLPPAFDFDPNTSSPTELASLGMSSKTIKSIINYRNKGGFFRKAEDFKRVYTLPDSLYEHLSGHIKIVARPQKNTYASPKAPNYQIIDINQASAEDFEQFRGIGPSYARRLLEWKERLGGFTGVVQIGELYRLPDSTFQQMRPFLRCAPSDVVQINVNTATIEELKAHPYLRWTQAKAIVQYREKKGLWKSVDFLQILPELNDGKGTFERVRPYLRVQ